MTNITGSPCGSLRRHGGHNVAGVGLVVYRGRARVQPVPCGTIRSICTFPHYACGRGHVILGCVPGPPSSAASRRDQRIGPTAPPFSGVNPGPRRNKYRKEESRRRAIGARRVPATAGAFVLHLLREPFVELILRALRYIDEPDPCVARTVGPRDLAFSSSEVLVPKSENCTLTSESFSSLPTRRMAMPPSLTLVEVACNSGVLGRMIRNCISTGWRKYRRHNMLQHGTSGLRSGADDSAVELVDVANGMSAFRITPLASL